MKKFNKMILLKVFLFIIIIILLVFITTKFISKKYYIDNIETIRVSKSGYLLSTCTCEIDFLNSSFMYKTVGYSENNEDKTVYKKINDKNINFFMKKANLYGFFRWNESYENLNVFDGKCVNIYITFKDGSVHETHCYAKFPLTYNLMADVFYEAFGYYIL